MATSPRSPRNFFPADLTPLLLSGWQTNKFDKSIPFWAEVDGLQFTDTSIRRKPGRSLIGDFSSQPIRGLFSINEYDTKVLYIGDLTNLYRWKLDDPTTIGTVVGSGYSLIETGGASVWDNGQAVWDNGDAVWDEGSIVASAWSFTNFGTWVFAADNVGRIKVKKDNEVFGELFTDSVSGAVISNSGTGHAVGDTLTFTGGAGQNFAVEVTEINNTFNVTNNLTKYAGKHTLVGGFNFQKYQSNNLFFPASNGVYIFNSLADFYTAANQSLANGGAPSTLVPSRFQFRYSALPGAIEPMQVLKSNRLDLYLQDEYNATKNLKLTFGVRANIIDFENTLFKNNSFS